MSSFEDQVRKAEELMANDELTEEEILDELDKLDAEAVRQVTGLVLSMLVPKDTKAAEELGGIDSEDATSSA
ncbi:hypothetical protein H6F88_01910 [Oculatella sp. FACHB-28]|uniref:hypothetical protein n=1 Tax=Oculatella sp. FACHB-28 TaxID=2692845 RepID=UPI001688047A|nr:hypothetical protein [Oculatella sp. FACHB-28]MBD2054789.1 hypothetical protein [Oculatella sp. FACHB-28]